MIRITNATKRYNGEIVLDHVNVMFSSGMIHGIVGRNGSGKTMLLKAICGIIHLTEGEILIDGHSIGREIPVAPDVGVIIETPGFLPYRSGYKNLQYLAALKGVASHGDICNAMKRVGLDPDNKKIVGRYSLGMRQRLGLAQAIMEKPKLLLLDEPFNGLDSNGIADMRSLLVNFRNEGGTVILASHTKEDIHLLCDDVFVMAGGKLSPELRNENQKK